MPFWKRLIAEPKQLDAFIEREINEIVANINAKREKILKEKFGIDVKDFQTVKS